MRATFTRREQATTPAALPMLVQCDRWLVIGGRGAVTVTDEAQRARQTLTQQRTACSLVLPAVGRPTTRHARMMAHTRRRHDDHTAHWSLLAWPDGARDSIGPCWHGWLARCFPGRCSSPATSPALSLPRRGRGFRRTGVVPTSLWSSPSRCTTTVALVVLVTFCDELRVAAALRS
jgi:hypothetical protein